MAVEATLASSLSLIVRLSAPHVLECLCPLWHGVDDDLQKLRRAMLGIQSIIGDAEERQVEDRAVKDWLTELKHAAYDAEDVLDQANTHLLVLRRKSELHGRLTSKVRNFFSLDNPLLFLLKLGSKLKDTIKKIDGIMEEMHKFNFKVYNQSSQRARPQTYSFVVESELVGRDADRDEIVRCLIDDRRFDDNVTVFSIVGMGGLGKTALAQLVYNDSRVERCFELRMWVCVSDDFDCVKLGRAIIESATRKQCESDLTNLELLQYKLRQALVMKRYLLVLDDVWNEDKEKWDKLRVLLTCGQEGSRVIVTTRNENCSSVMNAQVTHRPRCLSEENSWVLFEQHAFERGAPQHQNMVMIGKKIVSKCGGLPLAIKALGGLMRSKNGESEWLSVLDSEIWNLQPIQDGILPALWLSYVDMPYHLKKCFSFCAAFPKDYEIGKELLIQLWMANGFIPSQAGMDLEVKGNEIFNELVWRSFLQDVKPAAQFFRAFHLEHVFSSTFYFGHGYVSATTFKIHDLMHDLALCIVGDEIITGGESFGLGQSVESINIPKRTRHLLWPSPSSVKFSNCQSIRTFAMTNKVSYGEIKWRTLRALSVKSSSAQLASRGNWQLLRYLDLSGSHNLKKLPETICMLVNLQILKLDNCSSLIELPKRMRYMSSLRHLHLERCYTLRSMPPGLGQLKCLKTLTMYIVGSNAENSLQELKHLNLGGRLELYDLHMVKNASDAKEANMRSKQKINSLTLRWGNPGFRKNHFYPETRNTGEDEAVLEALEPHFGIKSLTLECYGGTRFPLWMGDLQNLVEITLRNCPECEQLPPLEQLPFLEVLSIYKMNGIKHIINSTSSNTVQVFPALKELVLDGMQNLEGWCVEEGREAFSSFCPSLIFMTINNCPKLTTKPSYCDAQDSPPISEKKGFFKNLKSLETLSIFNNCGDLVLLLEDEEETMGISSSLLEIRIWNCGSFSPSLGSWNLPSLKTLWIGYSDKLVSLPEEMLRDLKSLESLSIHSCENLIEIGAFSQGLSALPCLKNLEINNCYALINLPKCPTSLQQLSVSGCGRVEYVPQGLTALKSLMIRYCDLLKSFPDDLQERLPTIKHLTIIGCRDLARPYLQGGELRHLVSHIQDKQLILN
ncbi:hypothetical protein J5N97_020942 [Dioscorea zingiberensis]|uniref:Disease resistance protein RGA3 n=1 Tax=Dioscorea zingiberensis TaxID=325984 RepID=A0A9D5CI56_9LILI|nr:hypothetical protein J5N97_020942 [Dioscorea zingiberensis]